MHLYTVTRLRFSYISCTRRGNRVQPQPLPASVHAFLVFVVTIADRAGSLVQLHSILESAASDPWVLHVTSQSLL